MIYEPFRGKKVIAYYRVSTKDQGRKRNGLEEQRDWVRQLIEMYDHQLIDEVEEIESATTVIKRPLIQDLIDRVRKDKELFIITYCVDRIVRSSFDGYKLLNDVDGRVIFGDLPIPDPVTIANHFAKAEWEVKKIQFRTKRGVAQARKKRPNGEWGNAQNMTNEGRLKGGRAIQLAAVTNPNNIRAYNYMKQLKEAQPEIGWRKVAESLNKNEFRTSKGYDFKAPSAQRVFTNMTAHEAREKENQQLLITQ